MFNARTQKKIQPELLHKARVVTAAFDVDGRWLVTLTEDRSLHLWDLETGENPSNTDLPDRWGEIEIEDASLKIVDHRDALRDKNLSQSPQSYVLAPHNGKLEIWTWGGEINHADADTTLWPIRTRSALKVLGDGGLQVRNLATDGILMQIPAPLKPDYWKAVVTSPGNEYLATISDQGMVRLTWLPPEDPSRIIRIAREQLALTPSRIAQ